jgi:cobalamin biosynthesis protein CobT
MQGHRRLAMKDRYSGQQAAAEMAKFDGWMADARVSVNQMAMEFERKQAAHIDQRTQVGKSGRLDMGKLHNYKLTEDLFMRTELRPNGKNHAMTIVIDWSGSMDDKTISTMRQACILAMFCKKVNVPCEVYLFQSGWATLSDKSNAALQGQQSELPSRDGAEHCRPRGCLQCRHQACMGSRCYVSA